MNVGILVSGLPPERIGGAEFQAMHVARLLASRHRVTVFTRTAAVPPALDGLPGCAVVKRCRIVLRGVRFPADIVQTLMLIGRARPRFDALVAYQTAIDGLIGVLARRLFGIPVIVSIRSDMEYQVDRYRQTRWLSPFVFRQADRLAVQSQALGDELVRVFARREGQPSAEALRAKLFVLPNGIEPGHPRPGRGTDVVYVGRLAAWKNVMTLVEAMRECPSERLVVVGDGPERRLLEKAAANQSNITFVGAVAHRRVNDFIGGAKLLVLPSLQEGQPNVVMEAMALGVPVVATRVGGVPDLIAHGHSGWLVEPKDAAGLALAIKTLGSDEALRNRLATNAAQAIQLYAWPNVIAALEQQLEAIAHPAVQRGPHKAHDRQP